MKKILLIIILISCSISIFAQKNKKKKKEKEKIKEEYVDEDFIRFNDHIYKDYIKSVKFHIIGADLTLPIIDLSDGQLVLSFDDLEADVKNFYYTIVHCDKDWTPSEDISPMDYIDGFSEEKLEIYRFSSSTTQPYTHYDLAIPNEDMSFKLSGNYILKIYTDKGEDDLVLTRRFVVVDSKVKIDAQVNRAYEIGKMETHQEIDFVIDHKGFEINNPKQNLSVTVMQNSNWQTAYNNVEPLFIKTERLEYDYQGKIVFEGLKEYRYLDLRSFRFRTDKVKDIYEGPYGFDVELIGERDRSVKPYLFEIDINGNFIIETGDFDEHDIESDYALVTFYLSKDQVFENGQVYLYGKISDWQLKDEFKMTYNEKINAYSTKVFLKQGFYNYVYAFVPNDSETPDFSDTEGSHHEAENDYSIIVYYRDFGSRYDEVIGVKTINSIQQN